MIKSFTIVSDNALRNALRIDDRECVLSIITKVCEKLSLDPDSYELRHRNKTLDPSKSIHFCNLPNNAVLELFQNVSRKKEEFITVCIQDESCHRIYNSFSPNVTLWNVLEIANQLQNISQMHEEAVPACLYMRKEILGEAELKSTTLKELGLTEGKVMIRFYWKMPDSNRILTGLRANPDIIGSVSSDGIPVVSNNPDIIGSLSSDAIPIASNKSPTNKMKESLSNETEPELAKGSHSQVDTYHSATEICKSADGNENSFNPSIPLDKKPGEIIPLDEQGTLLYSLDSCRVPHVDVPDEFFELTVTDIKLMMNDLIRSRKDLEDRPLLTNAIREAQELSKINQYKATLLRIYFPERLVLQCIFNTLSTVSDVKDFVEKFVHHSKTEFYLYTTPPKRVLLDSERLFEVNCVPKAIIHYGTNSNSMDNIKAEYKSKMSSYDGASSTCDVDRLKRSNATQSSDSSASSHEDKYYSAVSVLSSNSNKNSNLGESSQEKKIKTNLDGAPKWFLKGKR